MPLLAQMLSALASRQQESSAAEDRAKALSDLRGRGINSVAISLAQAADNILAFVRSLRFELAFYIGCLNLQEQLAGNWPASVHAGTAACQRPQAARPGPL